MFKTPLPSVGDIINGDRKAFEDVFKRCYDPLLNLAIGLVKDHQVAEEQVQEIFVKLWEKRASLNPHIDLFPYLFVSVRNRCYNYLRDQKVVRKNIGATQRYYQEHILNGDHEALDDDTIERLHKAIAELPDKCREVFQLSRFEQLSHKQIAEKLSISTKTIENHITKAMKLLRHALIKKVMFLLLLLGEF